MSVEGTIRIVKFLGNCVVSFNVYVFSFTVIIFSFTVIYK